MGMDSGFQCGLRDKLAVCQCGITHWFLDEEELDKFMEDATKRDLGCPICGKTHMYLCDGFSIKQGHGLYHRIGVEAYNEACEHGRRQYVEPCREKRS